jgi:Flp pilus assembly protein CpaB
MKPSHLFIITTAGIGVIVTLGILLVLYHPYDTVQQSMTNAPESALSLGVSINSTEIKTGQRLE